MHLDLAKYVKEGWVNHMKYIVVGLGVKKYLDLSQDLAFIFVLSTASNITLPKKVHLVKAMVFPVVMFGCECWTLKKAEHRSPECVTQEGEKLHSWGRAVLLRHGQEWW